MLFGSGILLGSCILQGTGVNNAYDLPYSGLSFSIPSCPCSSWYNMVNKLRLVFVSSLLTTIAVLRTVEVVIVTQEWSGIQAVIFFVQRVG